MSRTGTARARFAKPSCEHRERAGLCPDCKARQGTKEAILGPDGSGSTDLVPTAEDPGENLEVLNADALPPIVVPGRTWRDYVARWIEMRGQGMKQSDIAEVLGLQPKTLSNIISKATKAGWLKFDHPGDRLSQELNHIIVDNIEYHLRKKDKRMTIEAAKGLGYFQSHQAVRVESDSPATVLALKIEQVGGSPTVIEGNIIGKPKALPRSSDDEAHSITSSDPTE